MTDREREEERIVDELLRARLPARPAPDRLKRAVAEQIARAASAGGRDGASLSQVSARCRSPQRSRSGCSCRDAGRARFYVKG